MAQKICAHCGGEFPTKNGRPPKLCPTCRESMVICGDCGMPAAPGSKYCLEDQAKRKARSDRRHNKERQKRDGKSKVNMGEIYDAVMDALTPFEACWSDGLPAVHVGGGWFRLV